MRKTTKVPINFDETAVVEYIGCANEKGNFGHVDQIDTDQSVYLLSPTSFVMVP